MPLPVAPTKTFKVFFAYAREDKTLQKELEKRLSSLKRMGFIESFCDQNIDPGKDSKLEIDEHLNTAQIILLLVSPDFLASAECYSIMMRAMARRKAARVIPVLLRQTDWEEEMPLGGLQPLPTNGMPVASWSSRDAALKDVVMGIREVITDLLINSSPLPTDVSLVSFALPPRNPLFEGREDVLEQLHNALSTQPVALTGLGGIGKTWVAIEYAYKYQDDYHYILFVRTDSRETLVTEFAAIAHSLDLPEKDAPSHSIAVDAVKRWLEENQGWLLILDNVEDWKMVSTFLPSECKGHVLLTTKAQMVGTNPRPIEIGAMAPEEGVKFLLGRLKDPGEAFTTADADRATATAIVKALGGLPLALDQAAAYIKENETTCDLRAYLELYRSKKGTMLLGTRVDTTLFLSFDKVKQANHGAPELLQLCAFLHPDAIPEDIIKQAFSELGPILQPVAADFFGRSRAIRELSRYSLLQYDRKTKTFSIHRLVQELLKARMDEKTQISWAERAIRAVDRAFPDVKVEMWDVCLHYLPHVYNCAELIMQWKIVSPEAAHLLNQTGSYLRERMQYEVAEQYHRSALEICRQTPEPENSNVATCYENLARLYDDQGRYTLAKLYYLRVLTIRKQALREHAPKLAQSLNDLGLLYYNQGKYAQAEKAYKEALDIDEASLEQEHSHKATVLNNLAWLYYNLGRYTEAGRLYAQARAIREKIDEPEHPEIAFIINAQATLSRAEGKYTRAEDLFKQAQAISENALGEDHPRVAMTINDLAWLYRSQGKYAQAIELYNQALCIRRQKLGEAHPHTATTLNDIAVLDVELGKYAEAEQFYQQVLQSREKTLGSEHPRVATTLYNMGWFYYEQGKYTEAEMHHERALKIRLSILGEEHSHVGRSLNGLGEAYRVQGKYTQAKECHHRGLSICERTLGAEHPHIATHLNNLASLYADLQMYSEAEHFYQQAQRIREQAHDDEDPRMAQILSNLASLYVDQNRYAEAEYYYAQALRIYQKTLGEVVGEDHPLIAQVFNGQARLQAKQTRYDQAEALYRKALKIRKRILGPKHPHVAQSLNDCGLLYLDQGKYDQAALDLEGALEVREQVLGSEHLLVAQTLSNLAKLHRARGEPILAELFEQQAMEIRKQILVSCTSTGVISSQTIVGVWGGAEQKLNRE